MSLYCQLEITNLAVKISWLIHYVIHMKFVDFGRLLALVSMIAVLSSCAGDPSKTYTIVGEYMAVDVRTSSDGETQDADLSTATITLYHKKTNSEGEVERVEMASKPFREGTVVFEGPIDSSITVEITTTISGATSEPLSTDARIGPGSNITFALVDFGHRFRRDKLLLKDRSLLLQDSPQKYSISGNVSGYLRDSQFVVISVETLAWNETGSPVYTTVGELMLGEDDFVFEAEIEEPTVAAVGLSGDSFGYWTTVVIEPGARISLESQSSGTQSISTMPAGWFSMDQVSSRRNSTRLDISATAEHGRHNILIDSWQQSYAYQSKAQEAQAAFEKFAAQQQANLTRPVEQASQPGDASTIEPDEEESASGEGTPDSHSSVVEGAAEGCEHVEVSSVGSLARVGPTPYIDLPEHGRLWRELGKIRVDALTQIATHGVDPMNSLLAMELGAFNFTQYEESLKDSLAVYDRLSSTILDEDLVSRRINPPRKRITAFLESLQTDARLVPGQKAPPVTLLNLQREKVELYDLFQQSDIVYLQFWEPRYSGWGFTHLGELHDSYGDHGLQIITVSLEPDWDTWTRVSEREQIQWTNLGDTSNDAPIGTIAKAYGRMGDDKSFLIDGKGCILLKDLSPFMLGDILTERYGEVSVEE